MDRMRNEYRCRRGREGEYYKGSGTARFVTYNCQAMKTVERRENISDRYAGSVVGLQQTLLGFDKQGDDCTYMRARHHMVYCFNERKNRGRLAAGCAIMVPYWMNNCVRRVAAPDRKSKITGRAGLVRVVGYDEGGTVDITVVVVYAKVNTYVKGKVEEMKEVNTELWGWVDWELRNAPRSTTMVVLTDANGHVGSVQGEGWKESVGRAGREVENWKGRLFRETMERHEMRVVNTHGARGCGKTYFGGSKDGKGGTRVDYICVPSEMRERVRKCVVDYEEGLKVQNVAAMMLRDHVPVRIELEIGRIGKSMRAPRGLKIDWRKVRKVVLNIDREGYKFAGEVERRMDQGWDGGEGSAAQEWDRLNRIMHEVMSKRCDAEHEEGKDRYEELRKVRGEVRKVVDRGHRIRRGYDKFMEVWEGNSTRVVRAILERWLPAAKLVKLEHEIRTEANRVRKERLREEEKVMIEAEKQNEWAIVWRGARVLGCRARGKRRMAMNVPRKEVPTKAEWKEFLAGKGEDGGCEAEEVLDEGEEWKKGWGCVGRELDPGEENVEFGYGEVGGSEGGPMADL